MTIASAGENDFVIALANERFAEAFNDQAVGPLLGGVQPKRAGPDERDGGWQWVDATPWAAWNDEAIGGTVRPPRSYVVEFD